MPTPPTIIVWDPIARATDRQRESEELGVDAFVDLETDPLEAAGEVDVVLDVIGGDILRRSTSLVRAGGTLVTAWQALFDHAHLRAGQTVLIHGAAGGVGSIAVQLARQVGSRVVGTGRPGDRGRALTLPVGASTRSKRRRPR